MTMKILNRVDTTEKRIPFPPEKVYGVLIDYTAYLDWMPPIIDSKLLIQEGDLAIAEFRYAVLDKKVSMECIHSPGRSVTLRQISGEEVVRSMDWQIDPIDRLNCQVKISLQLRKRHRIWFSPVGPFLTSQAFITALGSRLDYLSGGSLRAGYKVLELSRSKKGMVLNYQGNEYEFRLKQEASK